MENCESLKTELSLLAKLTIVVLGKRFIAVNLKRWADRLGYLYCPGLYP